MSLDYNFRKQDLSFQTWLEKINQIVVPQMPGEVKEGAFREHALSNMVRNKFNEGEFAAKLLVEGSIRGAYIAEEEDQMMIKLHSFASRTDQYLAARLAYEAMSLGAKVYREDSEPLTGEDLSAARLDALHQQWFSFSCQAMKASENIQIPIYQFLSISSNPQKWGDQQSLEQELIAQLSAVADSYLATEFTTTVEGAGEKSVAILQPHMKSLVFKDTDAAIVNSVEVPLVDLLQALGSSVLDGGGCWVFPATSSIPSSVLQTINSHDSANNVASHSGEPTEDEWKFIAQGPVIAFLMVAAADGKVDRKEVQRFVTLLQQFAARQELPHIAKMMRLTLANFEEIFERLAPGQVNPIQLMQALTNLIDGSLSATDAGLLKSAIFYLAKEVASSSGGFLGFGPKISKSEKMSLGMLAMLLGLAE